MVKMNVSGCDKKEVRISELSVSVKIVGSIAFTEVDMLFFNDTNRVLEGEFEFPLGEGQSISGYALDISGKLREGVVVEKDKGRQVFDSIVRRGIDPGLVEVTKGNCFRTKVYPLPAKGNRRIVFSYEQELHENEGIRKYILQPLTDYPVEKFSMKMNVLKSRSVPFSSLGEEAAFVSWKSGYSTEITKKDFMMEEEIAVTVPEEAESLSLFTETLSTDTYFYYRDNSKIEEKRRELPSSIHCYFDVSSSAENRNIGKDLSLLRSFIEEGKIKNITIQGFSSILLEKKVFDISQIDDIENYVRGMVLDGATDFSLIRDDVEADEIFVFTDGINTWNKCRDVSVKKRINIINSAAESDHGFIRRFAESTGGVYVNLTEKTVMEGINFLANEHLRITDITCTSGAIRDIYPAIGSIVSPRFSVSGVLESKEGELIIKTEYGTGNSFDTHLILSAYTDNECENISRIWAKRKIESLNSDHIKNKSEIIRLAKEFKIVTEETSMIVLDSVHDYVRYEITPPDDLKEEYERIISSNLDSKDNENPCDTEEKIYRDYLKYKDWWENGHEVKVKPVIQQHVFDSENSVSIGGTPSIGEDESIPAFYRSRAKAITLEFLGSFASENLSNLEEDGTSTSDLASQFYRGRLDDFDMLGSIPEEDDVHRNHKGKYKLIAWSPKAEYIKIIKKTKIEDMYRTYLELKEKYGKSPSFYLEVGTYFFNEKLKKEALLILSNLAELDMENADILRALGSKLVEFGEYELAISVFEELVRVKSEIPQFHRDLANALYCSGQYQKAVDILWNISMKEMEIRFREVNQICLHDMNQIIAMHKDELDLSKIDSKYMENLPLDLRVVLTWNTDDCDVDLWVTGPDGEKCYYSNRFTAAGGRLSVDIRDGYGPEEFAIKKAVKGNYIIQVHYFGTRSQKLLQPVIVQADVYKNFGKENQEHQILNLQLDNVKDEFLVGSVEID